MPTIRDLKRIELEEYRAGLRQEEEQETKYANPFADQAFNSCPVCEPFEMEDIPDRVGLVVQNMPDQVSSVMIQAGAVNSGHIEVKSITTELLTFKPYIVGVSDLDDIKDGKTYSRILTTDITAGHVLLSSVTGDLDDITDGSSYGKVATTSITAGRIIVAGLDSGVTARMFLDATTKSGIEAWRHASDVTLIDGGDIYTSTITASKIASNAITAAKIDAGAVTTVKLDALAVTAEKIAANAITTIKLNAGAVTANKINVTNLSSINANIGTITAGSIYVNVLIGRNGSVYANADETQAGVTRAMKFIDGDGFLKGFIGENLTAYQYGGTKYKLKAYAQGGGIYHIGFSTGDAGGGGGTGDQPAHGDVDPA